MAAVANVKSVGSDFGNQENLIRVQYDFSVDGGAIGDLDLSELSQGDSLARLVGVSVETLAEGATATISVGIGGGTEFLATEAVDSFTAGTMVQPDEAGYLKLADGSGKLTMSIATAALTAGKMTFIFKTMSF
jgi:hypothetical protein